MAAGRKCRQHDKLLPNYIWSHRERQKRMQHSRSPGPVPSSGPAGPGNLYWLHGADYEDKSAGTWRRVVWYKCACISQEPAASISIVTTLQAGWSQGPRCDSRYEQNVLFSLNVQTSSEVHTACYSKGAAYSVLGCNMVGSEADQAPPPPSRNRGYQLQ